MRESGALLAASLTTLLLVKPLIVVLRRRRLLDVPNTRSSHTAATPRGGGIAVLAGLGVGLAAGSASGSVWVLFAGAAVASLVGLADDVRGISAMVRLGLQLALSIGLAWWLLREASAEGATLLGAAVICTIWLTGYLNAFYFMDGINGISAVSAAAGGAWFLLLGHVQGIPGVAVGGAALMGASLGFLPWNVPRARVFLGDVGSYGIGTFLGCVAVHAVLAGTQILLAVAPLGVYLADTAWTLTRRISRGASWHEAHREHVYQRLCDVGWGHTRVAGFVLLTTIVTCLAAWWLPAIVGATVCAVILILYLGMPRLLHAQP